MNKTDHLTAVIPAEIEELAPTDADSPDYDVQLESLSQWQLAWRRFRRHRMAMIGSSMFLAMCVLGVFGPIFVPYDLLKIPVAGPVRHRGRPPSLVPFHPFGETGGLQRDVLTLVVNGARFVAAHRHLATAIVGGHRRDRRWRSPASSAAGPTTSSCASSTSLLAMPFLFVILVVAPVPRPRRAGCRSRSSSALFGWPGIARLVRSVLPDAARGGLRRRRPGGRASRRPRIIFRHILPNALSPGHRRDDAELAAIIIGEAFVSFLGFGVDATTPTLGQRADRRRPRHHPGQLVVGLLPGLAIALTVLGINFMGDGLRDALDPRSEDLTTDAAATHRGRRVGAARGRRRRPPRRARPAHLLPRHGRHGQGRRRRHLLDPRGRDARPSSASPAAARASPRSRSCGSSTSPPGRDRRRRDPVRRARPARR